MNHKVPGDGERLTHRIIQPCKNHPLPSSRPAAENAGVAHANLRFCTIECEHADWPDENLDGGKSCRTFNALFCKALNRHTTRNAPCALEYGERRPKPNW